MEEEQKEEGEESHAELARDVQKLHAMHTN
jgi:hypothetical protein